ncbi:MAG: hypothetical protein HXY42_12140 [Chloroflexi bacterium]|nr:hypothetical protein [Chloroflexota bacterium]
MTDQITLTTGQTCGLTGLSMQTIQRYIRRYPMGFSEQARKPRKGRCMNGDDVKNLLLINQMLHAKQKAHIEAALMGEYESPDLSLFEVANLLQMFNTITALGKTLEAFYQEVMREKQYLQKAAPIIRNHSEVLQALRFDVSKLKLSRILREEDFDHPVPAVDAHYKQARKNPIARWFGDEEDAG